MEYVALNNGTRIPAVGIGTFMMQPEEAEKAVLAALRNGYEMIDTANAYQNERAVGRAMKASGRAREEIYLSTKLWPSVYAEADRAIEETLARLDTDYIDLLYLHQPVGDYVGAYQAMKRAVAAGKVKSIGLSNFPIERIRQVMTSCRMAPQLLQVEAHPYYPQDELKSYLKDMGTAIMAWYPLGHGDKALMEEPVFAELADKYGKSNAQIILRWHIQKGNVVIPGSKNEAHIKANRDIFDFALTADEMERIAAINKGVKYYQASEEALQGYLAFAPDFDAQK